MDHGHSSTRQAQIARVCLLRSLTLPAALSTPGMALLEAQGAEGSDGLLNLSTVFTLLASGGADSDGDRVPDVCDNCPNNHEQGQEDGDLDGVGNVCDACSVDQQNDSDRTAFAEMWTLARSIRTMMPTAIRVCGDEDNCPNVANPSQHDVDANGIGDACQTNASCADGIDNDKDGLIDHPSDPGCSGTADTTETDPALPCDDGIDNDADALIDFMPGGGLHDPGCASGTSPTENPQCDDSVDNDGDGKVDWDGNVTVSSRSIADCAGVGSGRFRVARTALTGGLVSGFCFCPCCVAIAGGRGGRRGRRRGEGLHEIVGLYL